MNDYSNILIIDLSKQIDKLEKYLKSSWLPTIDIESLLSIIFSCFVSIPDIEVNTNKTIQWLVTEGFEFKENTDIQNLYIITAVQDVMQDIYDELLVKSCFIYEYFPYEYKQTLPDKSVVLTKINHIGYPI